jgi:hypothetical protein
MVALAKLMIGSGMRQRLFDKAKLLGFVTDRTLFMGSYRQLGQDES